MNQEQFYYWLDNAPKTSYIIRIARRHFWQSNYFSNEFLYYDLELNDWCWDGDWWEGEEEVKYIAYIPLDVIPPGIFEKLGGD